MATTGDWQIPPAGQPDPAEYRFDLARALSAVVGIRALAPDDAFTAEVLGTERQGNGVLIRENVALTIGYLVTEAETIWLTLSDGRTVAGHALAYDQETGFGLVQALARLDLPALPLGNSAAAQPGTRVVVAGAGGRAHAVAAFIVGKQEFSGYWEYLLDEAIFTAPAHPFWGGTAVIGPAGDLLGIGSLHVEHRMESGESGHLNMVVPIDLLKPILNDLMTTGSAKRPARPWLGLYATEVSGHVVVAGLATDAPADRAGLKVGDLILAVANVPVGALAGFYRGMWALGPAGAEIPLTVMRDGETLSVRVASGDRRKFLKTPRLH
jgi:S1-C subfamily serine protease